MRKKHQTTDISQYHNHISTMAIWIRNTKTHITSPYHNHGSTMAIRIRNIRTLTTVRTITMAVPWQYEEETSEHRPESVLKPCQNNGNMRKKHQNRDQSQYHYPGSTMAIWGRNIRIQSTVRTITTAEQWQYKEETSEHRPKSVPKPWQYHGNMRKKHQNSDHSQYHNHVSTMAIWGRNIRTHITVSTTTMSVPWQYEEETSEHRPQSVP